MILLNSEYLQFLELWCGTLQGVFLENIHDLLRNSIAHVIAIEGQLDITFNQFINIFIDFLNVSCSLSFHIPMGILLYEISSPKM